MTSGSLRDQIVYPHSKGEVTHTDEQLLEILKQVHLENLLDRFSWDSIEACGITILNRGIMYTQRLMCSFLPGQDWSDLLSGGERQRVSMGA